MKIAVLSGKGGTGKTTFSTNYARLNGYAYADCDVEEPNGFLFLKPESVRHEPALLPKPVVDESLCIGCGRCAETCQFNALAVTGGQVMVFEKLCHGCGACVLACPAKAISEKDRLLGEISIGFVDGQTAVMGKLNVGEPLAVPVIRRVKEKIESDIGDGRDVVVDCSPGVSCTVVEAIEDCDFGVLVTEPTAFGLHDLQKAVELMRVYEMPHGILVNRWSEDNPIIEAYAKREGIPVLGRIPFDRKIAEICSEGGLLVGNQPYRGVFEEISRNIREAMA